MSATEQLSHIDRYLDKNWLDNDYPLDKVWEALQYLDEKDAKYAKLRELAEKVATAGYYTHPLAGAIDELRNYLKEVK